VLTHFGLALREPVRQIHWAGTETADESMGYFEGAIQSGKPRTTSSAEVSTLTGCHLVRGCTQEPAGARGG
jgi:monoamine oxidase